LFSTNLYILTWNENNTYIWDKTIKESDALGETALFLIRCFELEHRIWINQTLIQILDTEGKQNKQTNKQIREDT